MARYTAIPKGYMTVGEVAKKMGVTVRALQYYDREGIFCPSCQSDGGRRLYSDKDIIKLHQILTLKSLGFSFDEIKTRLVNIETPEKAVEALTEQGNSLQAQIDVLSESLRAINLLKSEIEQMQNVDFSKYADIIVNLQLGNKYYSLIKHFDEKLLDYCHKKFDKATSISFINRFNGISDKIGQCIKSGVTPESGQGQIIAKEFWELITEFTGGDTGILPHLLKLGDLPPDSETQSALNAFIEPALGIYFKNSGYSPFGKDDEQHN